MKIVSRMKMMSSLPRLVVPFVDQSATDEESSYVVLLSVVMMPFVVDDEGAEPMPELGECQT
jgi:hypothetical protein